MTKRMEKMKLQADLKKLQSYRSSLESFKANLENKTSELSDELENTGKYMFHPTMSVAHGYPDDCYGRMWAYCILYSSFDHYTVCLSVCSQSPGVSKTRAKRAATPAAEPEVYSS